MDKKCDYCGNIFVAKRLTARFCSDKCKMASKRQAILSPQQQEISGRAARLGLPSLEKVDRTKAFSEEDMQKIRQLPRDEWLAYMDRPNSAQAMTYEERLKHYTAANFPVIKYYSSGGGGGGSLLPPKGKF